MEFHPQDKPGFIYLEAYVDNRTYVVQKKDGLGVVRLFIRHSDDEALRTIFVGTSIKECTDYAEIYETSHVGVQ